jgi:hypothetical protein
LDLNSINVQVAYAGTLRITLEDTDYTLGPYGELSANWLRVLLLPLTFCSI